MHMQFYVVMWIMRAEIFPIIITTCISAHKLGEPAPIFDMVIIDEASMIDTYLMHSLLKGLSSNCKIILVGDDHQLPSVGPGQLLRDLIESEKLSVVKLKELYRQGKDSNIISLAYDVRNGEINPQIFNKEEDLKEYAQWFPVLPQNPGGRGYWVVYQSALSGESVLLNVI